MGRGGKMACSFEQTAFWRGRILPQTSVDSTDLETN